MIGAKKGPAPFAMRKVERQRSELAIDSRVSLRPHVNVLRPMTKRKKRSARRGEEEGRWEGGPAAERREESLKEPQERRRRTEVSGEQREQSRLTADCLYAQARAPSRRLEIQDLVSRESDRLCGLCQLGLLALDGRQALEHVALAVPRDGARVQDADATKRVLRADGLWHKGRSCQRERQSERGIPAYRVCCK